jgi:O-succinylhomoserine sulfhydrylase
VKSISYPGHESHPQHDLAKRQMSGFGNMLAFEIDGGQAAAFRFLNALALIDISNNLGDSKSLACHPFTTTHANLSDADRASLNITPSHIRLSVGLEDKIDLIADLESALAAIG